MAQSKDFSLDEPYYGPAIPPSLPSPKNPPPPTPSWRLSYYSLLCTAFKITTIFLIIIGIIVLVLWLIYQPQSIKVHAESASLSTFNLSKASNVINPLLTYNLAVNLTFRNPNRKYSIYYERAEAKAFYDEHPIGSMGFPRMFQGRKTTLPVMAVFEGRREVAAGNTYEREQSEGFFSVRVKLYVTVRLKMVVIKSVQFKPDVDCYLRIPAPGNATSLAAGFARTSCDVNNFS